MFPHVADEVERAEAAATAAARQAIHNVLASGDESGSGSGTDATDRAEAAADVRGSLKTLTDACEACAGAN